MYRGLYSFSKIDPATNQLQNRSRHHGFFAPQMAKDCFCFQKLRLTSKSQNFGMTFMWLQKILFCRLLKPHALLFAPLRLLSQNQVGAHLSRSPCDFRSHTHCSSIHRKKPLSHTHLEVFESPSWYSFFGVSGLSFTPLLWEPSVARSTPKYWRQVPHSHWLWPLRHQLNWAHWLNSVLWLSWASSSHLC